MKAAYAKIFTDALIYGKLDDIYYEERIKLEDMLEKATEGITKTDICDLQETFEAAHNSKANIQILEEKYDSLMQLAARCGTVKEIYETELNKIASAAKYLPYSAVNIKKEILDKAHAKAYNMPENTSISIFNLKNGIIAIIIMFAALFSYAKIKRHIDFHTMSPEEKQRMEETANAVYSNRDIDGTFKSHSELQKKTGKKRTGF